MITRMVNTLRRWRESRRWREEGTYRQQLRAFAEAELIRPTPQPPTRGALNLRVIRRRTVA